MGGGRAREDSLMGRGARIQRSSLTTIPPPLSNPLPLSFSSRSSARGVSEGVLSASHVPVQPSVSLLGLTFLLILLTRAGWNWELGS